MFCEYRANKRGQFNFTLFHKKLLREFLLFQISRLLHFVDAQTSVWWLASLELPLQCHLLHLAISSCYTVTITCSINCFLVHPLHFFPSRLCSTIVTGTVCIIPQLMSNHLYKTFTILFKKNEIERHQWLLFMKLQWNGVSQKIINCSQQ